MSSNIAYVINQYPKVSHSFIRREILELERQGFRILRIALRGWDADLVDEKDIQERTRTHYVLQGGILPLIWDVIRTTLASPIRFMTAFALAIRMARKSERSLPYHLIYLAEACRILPWLESFGAKHVHAHFASNSSEVALLANVLGGIPFSFTVHGQDELNFGGMAEKVRRAAFIVTISSFGRSKLLRMTSHALWAKIRVVHCGLEKSFYDISPSSVSESRRLLCVGRLSSEKAQLILIEAAYRLSRKGIDFELVLAGDGEMRKDVEDLIAELGLDGQVRITGWISSGRVRDEMLAARALIVPSFSEGLPVVIMEAMALRRPVLASCIAGIPELVKHGETGWLFPSGSVDDLAEAMEGCLSASSGRLDGMGDLGYQRVIQRHSIEAEVAKLASLFRNGTRAYE